MFIVKRLAIIEKIQKLMEYYKVNLAESSLDNKAINWEMDEYLNHKRGVYLVCYFNCRLHWGLASLSYLVTSGEIIAPLAIFILAACVIVFFFKET